MAVLLLSEGDEDIPPSSPPPDAAFNYLWRRVVGDTGDGLRIAVVEADGSFTDWAVASGVDYEYRGQAVAENGTSTYGEWT